MSAALKLMIVDEFLPWAEAQEGRWELHDGVPTRITPERVDHVRTKGETSVALRFASRRAGCDCEVFGSGCGVMIDQRTVYAPDGAIVCGPKLPSDAILLVNLIVVVEVLSPATAAIDHGRKLSGYFSLASVEHYLILDPDRRVAIHHKRGHGDAIETRVLTEGLARLDPPGFEVAVEALFPLL
jgi:Uma2 family endonuclease